jgi:hypothetical protein
MQHQTTRTDFHEVSAERMPDDSQRIGPLIGNDEIKLCVDARGVMHDFTHEWGSHPPPRIDEPRREEWNDMLDKTLRPANHLCGVLASSMLQLHELLSRMQAHAWKRFRIVVSAGMARRSSCSRNRRRRKRSDRRRAGRARHCLCDSTLTLFTSREPKNRRLQ